MSSIISPAIRNDDNHAVRTFNQHQYLLEVTGYNDCTWNVIARNYRRFITQIDANETSAGCTIK